MKLNLFDGHCDTILRCYEAGADYFNGGSMRRNTGHVQLAQAHEGFGQYAQFFAIFADTQTMPGRNYAQMFRGEYDLFCREMEQNRDIVTHCTTGEQAEAAFREGKIAAFLSVEGSEILDCSLERLEEAYRLGVRAVNLTWNHANALSGTTVDEPDRGLSQQGRDFVAKMQELGMLVDVSHLSDPGFWDVVELSKAAGKPFFASHSNSRALCPHTRNLTDEQFRAIVETGGVAGLNLCVNFLGENPTVDTAVDHIEHFCALGGEKHISMGGDWDGCETPEEFRSILDVEKIYERLLQRNFPENLVRDIFYHNLMRVVKKVCTT